MDGYTRDQVWNEVNAGGGASVGKDVITNRDFVGRDQINVETVTLGKAARDEQYEIVLHWDGMRRLREFDLSGRNLSNLDLQRADLQGSNLSKVNLSDADLSNADLARADLNNADLTLADLTHAYFSGANLDRAKYNDETHWPKNFDPKAAGAIKTD